MKVLIADDSALICETIAAILETFLHVATVETVGDGANAIAKIKADHYDLVILDINIPRPNGIKVLEILKAHDPATRVIVFTNYPLPSYRRECNRLGAEYFLDKTTESQNLLNIVKTMMLEGWPVG